MLEFSDLALLTLELFFSSSTCSWRMPIYSSSRFYWEISLDMAMTATTSFWYLWLSEAKSYEQLEFVTSKLWIQCGNLIFTEWQNKLLWMCRAAVLGEKRAKYLKDHQINWYLFGSSSGSTDSCCFSSVQYTKLKIKFVLAIDCTIAHSNFDCVFFFHINAKLHILNNARSDVVTIRAHQDL